MKNPAFVADRSVSGLQSLLETAYELNPTVAAELGALAGLKTNVAEPLQQRIVQALHWLDAVDTLAVGSEETVARQSKAEIRAWRVLTQVCFAAQCELKKTARELNLVGCGWEEALTRCELAVEALTASLRSVVVAVDDIGRIQQAATIKPTTEYPTDVINSLSREANLTPVHQPGAPSTRRICGRAPTIRRLISPALDPEAR